MVDSTGANSDVLLLALSDHDIAEGLPELRWNVLHEVLGGCRTVVIDIAEVTTLTSSGVAALLNIHRLCRARRGQLVLRHPTGAVLELLRQARLDRLLTIDGAGSVPVPSTQAEAGPERIVRRSWRPGLPRLRPDRVGARGAVPASGTVAAVPGDARPDVRTAHSQEES